MLLWTLFIKIIPVFNANVVKEALWAISNAMCCSFSNYKYGFCDFWSNCNDMYWVRRLILFLSDKLLVMVFLEGVVNIGVVGFTRIGQGEFSERSVGPYSSFDLDHVFESIWFGTEMSFLVLEFSFREGWDLNFFYVMIVSGWNGIQKRRLWASIQCLRLQKCKWY